MIEVFESGGDIHQLSADNLPKGFVPKGKEYTEYKGPEAKRRQFAKKHVHAFNYGEGERIFAMIAGVSVAEGKMIRDTYFNNFPLIRQRQINIASELRRTRVITNPFGRKRRFFGRMNHDLEKKAFAQGPQSTIADVLDLALIRLDQKLKEDGKDIQLLLQVHDEMDMQSYKKDLPYLIEEAFPFCFDIPITLHGRTFTIPYEVSIGPNWQDLKELK